MSVVLVASPTTQIAWPAVGMIGVTKLTTAIAAVVGGPLKDPVTAGNNTTAPVAQLAPVPDRIWNNPEVPVVVWTTISVM